ncbi:transcriptional regulator [Xanthobacter dioxanivorans]|uniref:Transcriptional regulator n=1 Tax=Xanthobacter dioxanivorans TaxID=2528964 RepID=A0A974SHQ4_9HYPH|nr:transcriptional regulator [Xanthobacter dioxanivorans]QRG05920.1 transcriptional regulator [Xanthobacter dioxanivorans]
MLTAEQIRAARAALRWERSDLADRSGVSVPSIKRLEGMVGPLLATRMGTLDAIRRAFEAAGVTFLAAGEASVGGGPGVRLDAVGGEAAEA